MKKLALLAAASAVALSLAACSTTSPTSTTVNTNVNNVVAEVVNGVQQVCKYAPDAADVASLVAKSTGSNSAQAGTALASTLISEICGQVENKSARRGVAPSEVVVDGVVIHGTRE